MPWLFSLVILLDKLKEIWNGHVVYISGNIRRDKLTRSEIVKEFTPLKMGRFLEVLLICQVSCIFTLTNFLKNNNSSILLDSESKFGAGWNREQSWESPKGISSEQSSISTSLSKTSSGPILSASNIATSRTSRKCCHSWKWTTPWLFQGWTSIW